MPGGYGMSDLYKISINDDGSFGSPINLGDQINTEGKENFPFVTDEELYFSSNGHPGLGSLDIYRIKLTSTPNFMDVINVGAPINSPKDDFAYIMNPETKRGYFSSNRSGGKGGDDIYSIYESLSIKSFYLTTILGTVTDKDTQEPLEGVTVTIYDDQGNLIKEMTSKEDGKYYFFSEEELINSSIIKTTKQGYQPNEPIESCFFRNAFSNNHFFRLVDAI